MLLVYYLILYDISANRFWSFFPENPFFVKIPILQTIFIDFNFLTTKLHVFNCFRPLNPILGNRKWSKKDLKNVLKNTYKKQVSDDKSVVFLLKSYPKWYQNPGFNCEPTSFWSCFLQTLNQNNIKSQISIANLPHFDRFFFFEKSEEN